MPKNLCNCKFIVTGFTSRQYYHYGWSIDGLIAAQRKARAIGGFISVRCGKVTVDLANCQADGCTFRHRPDQY